MSCATHKESNDAASNAKKTALILPKQSFTLLILAAVFLTCFAVLFLLVGRRHGATSFDEEVSNIILSWHNAFLDGFFGFMEFIGGWFIVLPILAVAVLLYLVYKKKKETILYLGANLLAIVLMGLFKMLGDRPRPNAGESLESGIFVNFSFPSGHTIMAVTFFGIMIWLAPRLLKNRWLVWGAQVLSLIFMLSIILSRIYLQDHYATDVLGGICLGLFVICISLFGYNLLKEKGVFNA